MRPSTVARLLCPMFPALGNPFSWSSSFALSQLFSVTTETWLGLGSCSLGLLILKIFGTAKGLGGGCTGTERLTEESWREEPGASPQGQAQWISRARLKGGLCGAIFWASLVVITEDSFEGGRPRSKQPHGKGTVGIYHVRVTFLIRNSETH